MSMAPALTFARARLTGLGYSEWRDSLNFENIPKPRLDSVFHLELGEAIGLGHSQDNLEIEVPLIVRVFKAPARDTATVRDLAIVKADAIRAEFMSADNRLTQSEIKNVLFDTLAIEPLADSNDNGVIVRQEFTVVVIESLR